MSRVEVPPGPEQGRPDVSKPRSIASVALASQTDKVGVDLVSAEARWSADNSA